MIRHFVLFIIILFMSSSFLKSSEATLSDSSRISILTCSPGLEIYTLFGHTAIWVSDPGQGIEMTYNYGTFNFRTKNFYIKFIRRELDYILSRQPMSRFIDEYSYENRKVICQELNLTRDQRQEIFDALEENYKPENRMYRYDFFFDNCATRVRDIIEIPVKEKIEYNYAQLDTGMTLRDILIRFANENPWLNFGINTGLGIPVDRDADFYEYMLMPDYLMKVYDSSVIGNQPFVKSTSVVLDMTDRLVLENTPFYATPGFVFWGIFFLAVYLSGIWFVEEKLFRILDVLLMFASGLLGIVLYFLWFHTHHGVTEWNMNLLWAFPLNFFVAFTLIGSAKKKWKKIYFKTMAILCILFLLLIIFGVQKVHPAVVPIALTLLLRSLVLANWSTGKKIHSGASH